ncbi:DUF72 domain-containing protein [Shewanella inventionis]|uniref:DUF72 domain-containing protein n=1 Tax=Shewanella inventionis TaxID=1738770 RepID=A0ABQ1IWL5_9GAMM|nr:DUF72 domain-containing protein [Shewanella inventionis]MCL1156935.1 DUF72 domain-containing protein [Shewanella inventionis]UAL43099.1 DUF72 domain-containing protein [Shewanella inventionis]GGB53903.1 hypothetical protein GCM10011607_13050 [Shewanella inventionis]
MWSQNHWQHSVYGNNDPSQRLSRYADIFNTVEGNTTFYATPSITQAKIWRAAVNQDFRFTFKLPKHITHELKLHNAGPALTQFFSVMAPLLDVTGMWKIQLPASFGPQHLPVLAQFLTQVPQGLTYGVEVRHPAFFAKGDAERDLNRLLISHQCNRIIMDTRPVFAAPPTSEAVIDAHQKKPKVPVHAIATAQHPVVRFIGHPQAEANVHFFQNWLKKLPLWIAQGKQPYLFIHTPDNHHAPQLAVDLYRLLQQQLIDSPTPLNDINLLAQHQDATAQMGFDL